MAKQWNARLAVTAASAWRIHTLVLPIEATDFCLNETGVRKPSVRGDKLIEAPATELLILAVHCFGNSVGIEQQAEIGAELRDVLGEFTGKQSILVFTLLRVA